MEKNINKNIQVEEVDYEIFSLPKKEVKIVDKYMTDNENVRIKIRGKIIKHKCPKCGGYNTCRVGNGYETVIANHMFLSNYKIVQLEIEKRRFKCLDCEKNKGGKNKNGEDIKGSTFDERFSFIDYKCSYSKTYKTFILKEWEFSSISELARKLQVSESKVYAVINNTSIEEIEKEKIKYMMSLERIIIGIDELSFSGMDYIVQINALNTKKVIGIIKSKTKEDLEKWLSKLPIEVIHKIEGIGSDMNAGFKNIIQEHIQKRTGKSLEEVKQKVKSSVDHYHLKGLLNKLIMEVFNMSNWMIKAGHYDKIIKDISTLETVNFNKYRIDRLEFNVREMREYRPNDSEYRAITLGHFLSKRYVNLLLMKEQDLTNKQKHRLNQILFEFDPKGYLKEAYLGKELLNEAVKTKDMDLIEKLISDLKSSIQYKIQICAHTLEKWKDEIKNFFETGVTNAFTEGKNTKAKLFKRMAYGYISKTNYIKRLLICL